MIGIACSAPIPGRHLLQALVQMRNRGNGKGGGAALVGLDPAQFGVTPEILRDDYLLTIAYLDPSARAEVEGQFVEPVFTVDHNYHFPINNIPNLEIRPPEAVGYFVRARPDALERFTAEKNLSDLPAEAVADELVYRNTYRLNKAFYASLGEKRAFVLSHGKDMLVLKMVGYGDDVIRAYQLEDVRAHVWIGHHRYPTKGRVWHPSGAHPFMGMHEALVHNGDFANYASVCAYLAQRNIYPLFLTNTEVSVLVFDLLHRTYGYPLEYVIEALAPTTERDFTQLPPDKQETYRMLQTVHIHGSPDGPWFFLIAQSGTSGDGPRHARLIGITDTSMLRPQVFALQQGGPGEPSIGLAASEKQAIDAALASLAQEDARFWARPDRVWNARGGSHADGGAFLFDVRRDKDGAAELVCHDKFCRPIVIGESARPCYRPANGHHAPPSPLTVSGSPPSLFEQMRQQLPRWTYEAAIAFLDALTANLEDDVARRLALETLTLLVDRRYPTGNLRRSSWLSLCDQALAKVFSAIRAAPSAGYAFHAYGQPPSDQRFENQALVIDARDFAPEGPDSLALEIVRLAQRGFRHVIVAHARGHRFIGNGLGPNADGLRIEVYGSSGDYLASGVDGAEIIVHGNAQDQLAQIMKSGKLVVHGDVGQTFMYAAKGGEVYVLGNAAGRPLINAVGKPRVVINGTCLDYLAESFMAGDPLNGGEFTAFESRHWALIRPLLEENERLFGIPISWLLQVDGVDAPPECVYRAIFPSGHKALLPEEAWVTH